MKIHERTNLFAFIPFLEKLILQVKSNRSFAVFFSFNASVILKPYLKAEFGLNRCLFIGAFLLKMLLLTSILFVNSAVSIANNQFATSNFFIPN